MQPRNANTEILILCAWNPHDRILAIIGGIMQEVTRIKRDEFERQLEQLDGVITLGIVYFSAWRGLMVKDDDSVQALNQYRCFFLPARSALLRMTLMQFAKVFDRHHKTISLYNLLSAAKKDRENLTPHATEDDLCAIEQNIEASAVVLKRLKTLRDQRLAHHDAIFTCNVSLPYGEIHGLVEEIKSMYNSLKYYHNQSTTCFDYIEHDTEHHTSEVVGIIRKER